jgi:hypothetical protein
VTETSRSDEADIMGYFLGGINVSTRNTVKLQSPRLLSDAARMATEFGVKGLERRARLAAPGKSLAGTFAPGANDCGSRECRRCMLGRKDGRRRSSE